MISESGEVLYVGKAQNLRNRVSAYTRAHSFPTRLQRMIEQTRSMEFIVTASESQALLLEADLIQQLRPKYNVLLLDDKSFACVHIDTSHDFPRLLKRRFRKIKSRNDTFGPFASGSALGVTLDTLQRVFMLRSCSDVSFSARKRPCLQYQLQRCTAPCVGKVSKDQYALQVKWAREFLQGRGHKAKSYLVEQMLAASDRLAFENAGRWRDRLQSLTAIQTHQGISLAKLEDADIVAVHQQSRHYCMQVFSIRGGRNCGHASHYARDGCESELSVALATMLSQFYSQRIPPKELLISHQPHEPGLLAQALTLKSGYKVSLRVPKRGVKYHLVEQARFNARAALERKLGEGAVRHRLLGQLQDMLDLPAPPARIEVFDNSHLQGGQAIGAMIVAGAEGWIKSAYRVFHFNPTDTLAVTAGDDAMMIWAMLRRRFACQSNIKQQRAGKVKLVTSTSSELPDLIVVDGGTEQLKAAHRALSELRINGVAVLAMAKGRDRKSDHFFYRDQERFLDSGDLLLYYLQQLRDEAHRFAQRAHRKRRAKQQISSQLGLIKGLGAARRKQLLHHFGDVHSVAKARIADLRAVPGISAVLAQRLHDHFNQYQPGNFLPGKSLLASPQAHNMTIPEPKPAPQADVTSIESATANRLPLLRQRTETEDAT